MSTGTPKTRLEYHTLRQRYRPGLVGADTERMDLITSLLGGETIPLVESIWRATKEIVYEHGAEPRFTHIMHQLDVDTLEMVLLPGVSTVDTDEESLCHELAVALAYEIPVFPNTESDMPHLETLYNRILQHGVMLSIGGEEGRYTLTAAAAPVGQVATPEEHLVTTRHLSSVELMKIRRLIGARMLELQSAQSVLARIDTAIAELEDRLNTSDRNELALQTCLTQNPILFGLDYRRVIPQHKLGGEYIMDYALERHSGFVDLVEIEASTHDLFTQAGDPRNALVHAEQQVLDWLEWMEQNGRYARDKLPLLHRPRAVIVIGRSIGLSPDDARRLRQRNRILADVLEIYTYDDLLTRTRHFRNSLITDASLLPPA